MHCSIFDIFWVFFQFNSWSIRTHNSSTVIFKIIQINLEKKPHSLSFCRGRLAVHCTYEKSRYSFWQSDFERICFVCLFCVAMQIAWGCSRQCSTPSVTRNIWAKIYIERNWFVILWYSTGTLSLCERPFVLVDETKQVFIIVIWQFVFFVERL